jgi:hypothetical protein
MEIIRKESGSGITVTDGEGKPKTLEEFVKEEEDKERDRQTEEHVNQETGVIRRRTIYNQPHLRLRDRKDHPSGGKVYSQGEINTIFCERNLKLMAQDKPKAPLIQLVIGAMIDGAWYTPDKVANKILEANPDIKVDGSNVSWRMSQLRGSPVSNFIEKRATEAGRRGYEYSFARCLYMNLSAADIYGLYTKSNRKITVNAIKEKFPDIAAYLDRKQRKDKWSGSHESPVEAEPEVAEPLVKLADTIKRSVSDKLEVEIKVNGRIDFVFNFGILRGND